MAQAESISEAPQQWRKLQLDFVGPHLAEEQATFTDYKLDVTFRHVRTGTTIVVPGYFAADGDAANTGAAAGSTWRVLFNPPASGQWDYQASFRSGPNVATSRDASAGMSLAFDGTRGSFDAAAASTSPSDSQFRTDGMVLQALHQGGVEQSREFLSLFRLRRNLARRARGPASRLRASRRRLAGRGS
jgi:hypothetical protein